MYQVVFTGRLLKGADRTSVASELQRLFKARPQQVEWFLRGKPIVVKSCDDAALAERYHETLTKAGLECELRSDQPASASMAPPADEHAVPREQLPIPGVSATRPAPGPRAPPVRRTPTLGPVTQAITAQDRAPVFAATSHPAVAAARPTTIPAPAAQQLQRGARLLFLVLGAMLVGLLVYFVRQEWAQRQVPVPQVGRPDAGAQKGSGDLQPSSPVAVEPEPPAHDALIVGRWQCVEAGTGRVVENEFTPEGRYRSLAHGRDDAFQQVDQIDILVEGRYRLEGSTVVLHVLNIPSREAFGGSAQADDYLYWRIETLTRDTLVWADTQLKEVRESCLRSQALLPLRG